MAAAYETGWKRKDCEDPPLNPENAPLAPVPVQKRDGFQLPVQKRDGFQLPSSENTPTGESEIPPQPKKKGAIRRFFKRVWNAIKKPFPCCRRKTVDIPGEITDGEPKASPETQSQYDTEPSHAPEERPPSVPDQELGSEAEAVQQSGDSEHELPSETVFTYYRMGEKIGSGSFAEVYSGVRKRDNKKVAIKRIMKRQSDCYITIPGNNGPFYDEVVFLLMLKQFSVSPYIIELYDWFNHPRHYYLALEYPQPCVTLWEYVKQNDKLSEETSSGLIRQLVLGVQHCLECGVFHNDLHCGNVLVNTETKELKIIDFGLAHLLDNRGYEASHYRGGLLLRPPEVLLGYKFHAVTTSVWVVGNMLFFMVTSMLPFGSVAEILIDCLNTSLTSLSNECKDLIYNCLKQNPKERLTFTQILEHAWLRNTCRMGELQFPIYEMS